MRIAKLKWILPAILATGGWAQEVAANWSAGQNFPAVGIVSGQALRITVLNTLRSAAASPLPTIPCRVSVSIYDASGQIAKEETIDDLPPGAAKWVDYSPPPVTILVYPPPRITLAAVVRVSVATPVSGASMGVIRPFCSVLPTLEVLDTSSSKTIFALSGGGLVPSPLPAAVKRSAPGGTALSQDAGE